MDVSHVVIDRMEYWVSRNVGVRVPGVEGTPSARVEDIKVSCGSVRVTLRMAESQYNGQLRVIEVLAGGAVVHYAEPRPKTLPEGCVKSAGQVVSQRFLKVTADAEPPVTSEDADEAANIQDLLALAEVEAAKGNDYDVEELSDALANALVPEDRKIRIKRVLDQVAANRERVRSERAKIARARQANAPVPPVSQPEQFESKIIPDDETEPETVNLNAGRV